LKDLEAFRVAASSLVERPTLGHDVFAAPVKAKKIDPALIPLAEHQSELLVQAFHSVLSRLSQKSSVMSITIDTVSVVERMRTVVDRLKEKGGGTTFLELLEGKVDRVSAIGVFVAVLELCRRRMISVAQAGPGADITISLSDVASAQEAIAEEPVEVAA
jgi:chromatin segregation and condensation protein Rec8/ScpA/Scc1 (kleisin family)